MIVVGNEKGGSGKSTVAMHLAIALLKSGGKVASLDLDSRQKTFTHYIENRHAWAQHTGLNLEIPDHRYFIENSDHPTAEDEAADGTALTEQIGALAEFHDFIVIDTPGRDSYLGRLAHSVADTLITPMNDSLVDLDVLGTIDRNTMKVNGPSHYAQMVDEARRQRHLRDNVTCDWIVLRNRLVDACVPQHPGRRPGAAGPLGNAAFPLRRRPRRARDLPRVLCPRFDCAR